MIFQLLQRPHAAQSSLRWSLGSAFSSDAFAASNAPQHIVGAAVLSRHLRLRSGKCGRAVVQRERHHPPEVAGWRELVRGHRSRTHRLFPRLLRYRLDSASENLMTRLFGKCRDLILWNFWLNLHRWGVLKISAGCVISNDKKLLWPSFHPEAGQFCR